MLQLHNVAASVSLWTDLHVLPATNLYILFSSINHDLPLRTDLYYMYLMYPSHNHLLLHHHLHQHRMLRPVLPHSGVRNHPLRLLLPPVRGLRPARGDPNPHLLCTADLDLADCVRTADATGTRVADMEAVAETDEGYVRSVREGREGVHLWDVAECDGMTEDA
jgi:hypothetical protein